MKFNKILTLTIGIPAYNEEANIENLIKSLLKQRGGFYKLKEIIVNSDGSTDRTDTIVKELAKKYKSVKLISDGKRKGKTERLNELFQRSNTDLFMLIDADIGIENDYLLNAATEYFYDKTVGMVGFNAQPVKSKTLVGKLINKWDNMWYKIRKDINKGDTIHNTKGAGFVIKGILIKKVKLPSSLQQIARYFYLSAKINNLKFVYAKNIFIFYRSPEYFSEYISVLTRGDEVETKFFEKVFGKSIDNFYTIPFKKKARILFEEFIHTPILFTLTFIFIESSKYWARNKNSLERPGIWMITNSTKKLLI